MYDNMKKLFLLGAMVCALGMTLSVTASAQVVYPFNADGEAEFSEVVECSLPKETVYKNALELAASKSGKIVMRDDANYKLIFKCTFNVVPENKVITTGDVRQRILNNAITYNMSIECKDGRYRIKMTQIDFRYMFIHVFSNMPSGDPLPFTRRVTNDTVYRWNHYYVEAKKSIEELESKDTTKMKKEELLQHTKDLRLAKEALEYFGVLNQNEYEAIVAQMAYAKEKLTIEDDF